MSQSLDDPISALGGGNVPGWGRLLLTLGVFPGLAIWLVWILATRVEVKLDAIAANMEAHQASALRIEQKLDEEVLQRTTTNMILRQICVSVAADATARRECNQ